MKRSIRRILTLALCLALAAGCLPLSAQAAAPITTFPDVAEEAWYAEYIYKITRNFPGIIINGMVDPDGVTRFHPDDDVKRGEFLKLAITAAEATGLILYTLDTSRDSIHWAGKYYTLALEDNLLTPNILGSEQHGDGSGKQAVQTEIFPCTLESLDQPISRYEMAVILSNLCANTLMEKTVVANDAYTNIADYSGIGQEFSPAVEQAYGKGLLIGYEDGAFHGERTLTRGQAATVIERLLWDNDRQVPDWSEQPEPEPEPVPDESAEFRGYKSFAFWLQNEGSDAWGNLTAEARTLIFGDPNKTYFYSAADAAPYMENVTLPVWVVDKWGGKQPSSVTIQVHKLVAAEVRLIFQQIYDDPEQFPIYAGWSVGGARFSDTMRHSWGMAIDINALFNAECNFRSGWLTVTCGYGWLPAGVQTWAGRDISTYRGSMTSENSIYSITPTGSVVRAFATYGWGWGGSGSNIVGYGDGWGGKSYDFMHFSVLPSGG